MPASLWHRVRRWITCGQTLRCEWMRSAADLRGGYYATTTLSFRKSHPTGFSAALLTTSNCITTTFRDTSAHYFRLPARLDMSGYTNAFTVDKNRHMVRALLASARSTIRKSLVRLDTLQTGHRLLRQRRLDSYSSAVCTNEIGGHRLRGARRHKRDQQRQRGNRKNAASVVAADDALPAAARMPLGFALGAAWNHPVSDQQQEADHIWSSYTSSPSYLRWSGKPLLVMYGPYDTALVPDAVRAWSDPHFTVRHAAQIADSSNPLIQQYASEGIWGWYLPEPQLASSETIAVSPGYDRKHAASPAPSSIDREQGMHYMREWLFAIKHHPQNIVVASWDDFAEETQIAPSLNVNATPWVDYFGAETPDWYLQITSAYSHLRTGLMSGVYYRDEDTPAVYEVLDGKLLYQSVLPHGHPVIYLPAGSLKNILIQS